MKIPRKLKNIIKHPYLYIRFFLSYNKFKKMSSSRRLQIKWKDRWPCLYDNTRTTYFDRHYVYHPAWAARILIKQKPEVHIDIGSSLFFVSVISAFINVKFYDYRPVELTLDGIECGAANLINLPFKDRSIESLSCMHVLEHIGLGRYGDPIDPDGDIKAIKELQRVLAPGGNLFVVVPVGEPKVMFNGQRVYSRKLILELFDELQLVEFCLIPQFGPDGLIINASDSRVSKESNGCGCFWFMREE